MLTQIADSKEAVEPQLKASATRAAAQEAWARGRRDAALTYASRLKGSDRNLYARYTAMLAIRDGLAMLELGEVEAAERILGGGLLATGMPRGHAERISSIYCATVLPLPEDVRPLVDSPKAGEVSIPVVLPGFGWSGSGALLDFLKGFAEVDDPLEGRETEIFSGNDGLFTIYRSYRGDGKSRSTLRRFLAHYCFAHVVPGSPVKGRNARGLWSWIASEKKDVFLKAIEDFVSTLMMCGPEQDREHIHCAVKRLTTCIVDCLSSGGRYVVFGNCIPAQDVAAVQVFENPVVVVTWRDCIDSHVSKRLTYPDDDIAVESWMIQAERRARRYQEGKAEAAPFAKQWVDLRFEDFVRKESARDSLAASLGLDQGRWSRTFDPAHSSRNIGLENYLSDEEIKVLKEFREVMSGIYRASQPTSLDAPAPEEPETARAHAC